MNAENLKTGNDLQQRIKELKNHLLTVFDEKDKYNERKGDPFLQGEKTAKFVVDVWFSSDYRKLENQFVPFPIDKFMKIYKSNVEEEIKKLEKEFEQL